MGANAVGLRWCPVPRLDAAAPCAPRRPQHADAPRREAGAETRHEPRAQRARRAQCHGVQAPVRDADGAVGASGRAPQAPTRTHGSPTLNPPRFPSTPSSTPSAPCRGTSRRRRRRCRPGGSTSHLVSGRTCQARKKLAPLRRAAGRPQRGAGLRIPEPSPVAGGGGGGRLARPRAAISPAHTPA